LNKELESFVASHTNSAWTPGARLWLARKAQLRSGYLAAMDHYQRVWDDVKGLSDDNARAMSVEAASGLAKLLALTGRMEELDLLEVEAKNYSNGHLGPGAWTWAQELRVWARKHPTESYKCGLYCLDTLGRLTQPGLFSRSGIVETASSTNGYRGGTGSRWQCGGLAPSHRLAQ